MTRSGVCATTRNAAGFALAEVTVAAAILTVALIPIAALVVGFSGTPHLRHEMTALALAREWMEDTLYDRAYTEATRLSADNRWRLHRTAVHQGELVTLTVRVYRATDSEPRITLTTVRPAEPP